MQQWYESHGFVQIRSYLHVYVHGKDETEGVIGSSFPGLKPVHVFAHYTGDERDDIVRRFGACTTASVTSVASSPRRSAAGRDVRWPPAA